MPTTLSQTDICNMALSRIGCQKINNIAQTDNTSAIECSTNWQLSFEETARSHAWNCLMKAQQLSATPQTPIAPPVPPVSSTPWAPLTSYAANVYVTYGGALYQALIANTSTNSFINDLTSGFWFETDEFSPFFSAGCGGSQYASGWAYQFPLPSDIVLMVYLNDVPCKGAESTFEIIGTNLYTSCPNAVIKYVSYVADTTQYDPLFTGCLVLMLASKIATKLRQDDSALSDKMTAMYMRSLTQARQKDAGERKERRFSPVRNSRFILSRWSSTND